MATARVLSSKPHFFQPVLPGFRHQFSIPVSFFKYLKGEECEKAVLRSPTGKLWHVEINGRHFQDGWEEFAQDHDLHVGDFLVFRLEEGMMFDVMVFDPSACEREYLSFHVKEEIQTSEEEIGKKSSPRELKKKVKISSKGKADSSVLKNPYFVVNLTSYSISRSRINIPREISRTNGLCNRCSKIVLMDQAGRSWIANGYKKSDGKVRIGQGLSAFYTANDLKAGDSFIFELLEKGKKPILKMRELTRKKQVKTGSNEIAGASVLEHSFVVNMTTYKASQARINLPRKFARLNGLSYRCGKIVLIDQEGRSWVAGLGYKNSDGQPYIGKGWAAFRKANDLKARDSFTFELIEKGKKPVLKMMMRWKTNRKAKKEPTDHVAQAKHLPKPMP